MKRDIAIDLTPLLDVILTLLFIIMVGSSTKAEAIAAEADSLRAGMSEASERADAAESGLSDARQTIDEQNRALDEQSQLLGEYETAQEAGSLQGASLAQYEAFDAQVSKLDLRCVNTSDGCELTLTGADGSIHTMTIHADSDRPTATARLATMLRDALDGAGDGVIVLAVRYNNFRIHVFEYQIIADAVSVARDGCGARLLYAEASQTNP